MGEEGFDIAEGSRCVSYRGHLTFRLDFSDVRLGPGQILGEEGAGLALSGKWLGMGRVWVGATCCGKAERLLNLATEWAAMRRQFGRPIGQFQATGFKLADTAVELRAGPSCARRFDTPRERYPAVYAWTGFVQAFRDAGFEEVARRSETRPIMRKVLG